MKNEKSASAGKKAAKENKMGTMPVNKLLISMAIPLMLSNFVQALYNVVDSLFVARITSDEVVYDEAGEIISAGTDALNAIGLAFPVQIIIIALGIGTGVGVGSVLSRSLGEKRGDLADSAAMHGIFLMLLSYLISLSIGLFFARAVIAGQGATGRTLEYGATYLRIICCCSLAVYMEMMLERLLQSTGRTHLSMIPQITGAVINVIMDPILIFGIGPFPKMGVAGAALATVFGQTVATALGLFLNLRFNPDIHLSIRKFRISFSMIRNIYVVGLPAIAMQAVGSIMNFGMNSILLSLSNGAVAVFTVYYKLQSFFFMPLFGLNNAVTSIVAFNFGARNKKRMMNAYKLCLVYSFAMIFIGFLLFELTPRLLLTPFDTKDASLFTIGIPALRIIGVHYLFAWFCIVTGGVFQALGNGIYSLITSLMRQLVVLLPAAWILGKIGGLALVWWSFPIAELMSLTVTAICFLRIYRRVISKIPNDPPTSITA
ncbi:MAG: MATE family efflux transporter [Lachnospiraceae bacterium]|nr:MATE family efflux transporter [Lachnospiraceae bacterium]